MGKSLYIDQVTESISQKLSALECVRVEVSSKLKNEITMTLNDEKVSLYSCNIIGIWKQSRLATCNIFDYLSKDCSESSCSEASLVFLKNCK